MSVTGIDISSVGLTRVLLYKNLINTCIKTATKNYTDIIIFIDILLFFSISNIISVILKITK